MATDGPEIQGIVAGRGRALADGNPGEWLGAASAETCNGKAATHVGTAGNDVITGGPGDDVIVAKQGGDRIDGGAGNDTICAGRELVITEWVMNR